MHRTSARIGALSATAMILCAGLAVVSAPRAGAAASTDAYADLPASITLTGTLRDFHAYNAPSGHPDFEQYNTGHRIGLVQAALDSEGKPVHTGSKGRSMTRQYKDNQGRNINPAFYDPALGDVAGATTNPTDKAVDSVASFAQWYRDVPAVNTSKPLPITLTRQPNTNKYVFSMEDNEATSAREGFFPADNDLFNEMDPTYHHNYHFTFELATVFTYKAGQHQTFRFVGDDDVYVFIDGTLAIDVGGVHGAVDQLIDLDRFAAVHSLQDGRDYSLKFFFAERHTTRSNCRIETSLTLRPVPLPTTTALHD